ncbi:chaperone protein dnaJ 11, chloroplastic-like [Malania oleifera]|uniref:chaperone protein dnaJ 11, chloroplastic-like n=1 Tax=Malania oleifera TaxID=397392 RepID=UPI0025ADB601|nr:chaperone protein dnaJ 11, chloroplastic-like [Malania oleifera]
MISASTLFSHFIGSRVALSPAPLPVASYASRPSRVSAACTPVERPTAVRPRIASSHLSLYEVLGVQPGATGQEIKAAYRRLARAVHPDVASESRKDASADDFIRIHAAYSTLSDPEKRADYDRRLQWQRRPVSYSPFVMSAMTCSPESIFSGRTRRTWETDQCW